jgi:hypothetical protein
MLDYSDGEEDVKEKHSVTSVHSDYAMREYQYSDARAVS